MPEPDGAGEERTRIGQFAVVNASELLERLGYYGVLSVVALYLKASGYADAAIGGLFAVLLPLPYVVPMLAGPLAARFGYRLVMLAAFVAYGAGFLMLGASPAFPMVLGGIVLVGVGAGLFKPLTAAAIGLVTAPRHRSLGYTLYYVGINVGGFVGPLLVALVGEQYRLAFLVGAATVAANFLLVLALFRNPVPPQPGLGLAGSLRPIVEVLANRRFLALLAIFAGFWMLYSMNFSFVILYLQSYVALPGWFRPSLQVSMESLFVIILGVPLGALATRMPALRTMTVGILLLVAGFATVGLFPVFPLFVLGIALVAAGEVLAYPGFLAYVTDIAPRDRVAVYQSFGFLPLFAGFLVGPLVGGALYGRLVTEAGRPGLFWALMCVLGLAALSALLVYARRTRPADARPATRRGAAAPILPMLAALLLVGAGFATGARTGPPGEDGVQPLEPGTLLGTFHGAASEGQAQEIAVAIPAGAGNVTLALRWMDEAPGSPLPGAVNGPDTFELRVRDAAGVELGFGRGSSGEVVVAVAVASAPANLTATVTLAAADDTRFAGQVVAPDGSNAWTLRAVAAQR